MAKKIRLEFLYDRKTNKTNIYVWDRMDLLDTLDMNGTLSKFIKEKVYKEMSKRYEDKK